ncbi:MAG TPA: hypothetical protein VD788_08355 [Candidatus Polarisedimenticolaceae bacterium]|nr:hypothetical protein [Candidatus Polarisedimenticolaceae bacterium]
MNFPTTILAGCEGRGPARQRVGPRLVSCLIVLAVAAVNAQDRGGVGRDAIFASPIEPRLGVLEVRRFVDIERVAPAEFVGGSRSSGHYRPGGFATVDLELDTRVLRSVPAVWRMRVGSVDALSEMNVRYELSTADGRTNLLAHAADPGSIVQARVDGLPPTVVDVDDRGVLVEGGVMLHLDLQGVRAAGAHTATMTVTIEHF